ncbi:MAG: hypothetical protein ACOY16_11455 [Chloroflexota bacterium]
MTPVLDYFNPKNCFSHWLDGYNFYEERVGEFVGFIGFIEVPSRRYKHRFERFTLFIHQEVMLWKRDTPPCGQSAQYIIEENTRAAALQLQQLLRQEK